MEVFCYALSPSDGSEWRQRIEREAEHFFDVSMWSVPDIAGRISADQIQVGNALLGLSQSLWTMYMWAPGFMADSILLMEVDITGRVSVDSIQVGTCRP